VPERHEDTLGRAEAFTTRMRKYADFSGRARRCGAFTTWVSRAFGCSSGLTNEWGPDPKAGERVATVYPSAALAYPPNAPTFPMITPPGA
jgi:hypothetical protein